MTKAFIGVLFWCQMPSRHCFSSSWCLLDWIYILEKEWWGARYMQSRLLKVWGEHTKYTCLCVWPKCETWHPWHITIRYGMIWDDLNRLLVRLYWRERASDKKESCPLSLTQMSKLARCEWWISLQFFFARSRYYKQAYKYVLQTHEDSLHVHPIMQVWSVGF